VEKCPSKRVNSGLLDQSLAGQEFSGDLLHGLGDGGAAGFSFRDLLLHLNADLRGEFGRERVKDRGYIWVLLQNFVAHNGRRVELWETVFIVLEEDKVPCFDGSVSCVAYIRLG